MIQTIYHTGGCKGCARIRKVIGLGPRVPETASGLRLRAQRIAFTCSVVFLALALVIAAGKALALLAIALTRGLV